MTTNPKIRTGPRPSFLHRLRAAWAAHRMRRVAVGELQAMSEHELKDLGIGRSEIPALARAQPRTNTRSQTPWPSRRPRCSNFVSGRYSGRGA
ncbi:hypothetical protein X551_02892 [Methylibium sp. T29]|uniref:DUF1127 domain-containing protein n=1 Tax=Methylibium sp. T29-B TaxID=1437443 RepID=UPI0003F4026B|nr:hypothetical protein X551_02892 [Methylibium sp. T29]EWS59620.1 hypothetical protein Y694_02563 [Methylibium sp. T29-B]